MVNGLENMWNETLDILPGEWKLIAALKYLKDFHIKDKIDLFCIAPRLVLQVTEDRSLLNTENLFDN